MSEELDVLGTSLLNRVSAGRREAQRDLRRQQQIQGAFKLLEAGVRVGNQVLDRRAEEVTNRDDFQTNQTLIAKASADAMKLIEQDKQAQEFAGGDVAWLAKNRFYQPILDSFNRANLDENFASKDVEAWAEEQSLKAAQDNIDTWRAAVSAAYKVGGEGAVSDYEDYVKLNDGVAENIGGLLFNKAANYLTGKTDRDIQSQVADAVGNNRYVRNSRAFNEFNQQLQQGISIAAAKEYADLYDEKNLTDDDMRIRRREDLPFVLAGREPVKVEFYTSRGAFKTININKETYTQDGVTTIGYAPLQTLSRGEDGRLELKSSTANEADFKEWIGSAEGQELISSNNATISPDSSTFRAASQLEFEEGLFGPNPIYTLSRDFTTAEVEDGIFGEKYQIRTYKVLPMGRGEDPEKSRPLGTYDRKVRREVFDTENEQYQNMPQGLKDKGYDAVAELFGSLKLSNGDQVPVGFFDMFASGTKERYDDLVRENRGNTDFGERFKDRRERVGFEVIVFAEQIKQNTFINPETNIPITLTDDQAEQISAATFASQLVSSFDPDREEFNNRYSQINPKLAPKIATLYGMERLNDAGIPVDITNEMRRSAATNAYQEFAELSENPNIEQVEKQFYANQLLSMPVMTTEAIPFVTLDPNAQNNLVAKYGNRIAEEGQMISLAELVEDAIFPDGSPRLRERTAPPAVTESAVNERQPITFEGLVQNIDMTDAQKSMLRNMGMRGTENIYPTRKLEEYRTGLANAQASENEGRIRMFTRLIDQLSSAFGEYLGEDELPK